MAERRIFLAEDGTEIPVTWKNLQSGLVPWEQLDDEELARGKLKDGNGQFRGRVPDLLPREMVTEVTRRLKDRYDARLRETLLRAQGVFIEVMDNSEVDPQVRLRAAQYIQERLIGKVADKVEVVAEVKPWEGLVGGVLEEKIEPE